MSEMYQRTLFGDEIHIDEIPKKPHPHKYKTMQQINGTLTDRQCGKCAYFLRIFYHDRTYFKCKLWHLTHGASSDIRKSDSACGLWKEGEAE